jgi:hypothetical protein
VDRVEVFECRHDPILLSRIQLQELIDLARRARQGNPAPFGIPAESRLPDREQLSSGGQSGAQQRERAAKSETLADQARAAPVEQFAADSAPEVLRRRCDDRRGEAFRHLDSEIHHTGRLPPEPGNIVIMNHLACPAYYQLPNHYHLSFDTAFVSVFSGAFRLALKAETEPLVVPIALAGFDRRDQDSRLVAIVQEPLRLSAALRAAGTDSLRDFLDAYRPQFRRAVLEADRLSRGQTADADAPDPATGARPQESAVPQLQ